MTAIGSPGWSVPQDGLTRLIRRIEDLERTVKELGPQTVNGGTIQSTNFDGVAKTNTVGTQGYGLDGPSGNAVFNNVTLLRISSRKLTLRHNITVQNNSCFNSIFAGTPLFMLGISSPKSK